MASDWPAGFGQLTPIGMRQHYDLGLKLRQRYVHDLALVPSTYHKDDIYVQSTQKERTLQSAQRSNNSCLRISFPSTSPLFICFFWHFAESPFFFSKHFSFMLGFYPPSLEMHQQKCPKEDKCDVLPFGIQPVPIHSFEKKKDSVLYAYKNCVK